MSDLTREFGSQDWRDLTRLVQTGRHYPRAPIAEAIIEIRVKPGEGVVLDDLSHLEEGIVDFDGPAPQFSVQNEFEVQPDLGVVGRTTGSQVAHMFRRSDQRRIVQAALDRFSYSWLPPYDRWETFSSEALEHWDRYRKIVRPDVATRLGVRFVNKIDIPSASIEIKDYLRTSIDISPYLPQGLSSYFMQVDVPLLWDDAVARIISTLVPPPAPDMTSLVLDIDAWRQGDLDLSIDEAGDTMRRYLDGLRNAKNYVFEACITDATRGLIS